MIPFGIHFCLGGFLLCLDTAGKGGNIKSLLRFLSERGRDWGLRHLRGGYSGREGEKMGTLRSQTKRKGGYGIFVIFVVFVGGRGIQNRDHERTETELK